MNVIGSYVKKALKSLDGIDKSLSRIAAVKEAEYFAWKKEKKNDSESGASCSDHK